MIKRSNLANFSGHQTSGVSRRLGIKIWSGFVSGFGLPAIDLTNAFQSASTMAFSFKDVERKYIDLGSFGKWLSGRQIDLKNPATCVIVSSEGSELNIVDSIISSKGFSIHTSGKKGASSGIDIPVI
jgi:hypothetical protein